MKMSIVRCAVGVSLVTTCLLSRPTFGADPAASPDETKLPRNRLGELLLEEVEPAAQWLKRPVFDSAGTKLGDVVDLAIDLDEGIVALVLVSKASDQKKVIGLPPVLLKVADDRWTVDAERVALQKAPAIETAEKMPTRLWATVVYDLFRVEPAWHPRRLVKMWNKGSQYLQGFDLQKPVQVSGRIEKVVALSPAEGMPPGMELLIVGEGERSRVQMGPLAFLAQHDLKLEAGDQVKVEGWPGEVNGQPVVLAGTILHEGGSIQLRDRQGVANWPEWTERDENYVFASYRRTVGTKVHNVRGTHVATLKDFALARPNGVIAYVGLELAIGQSEERPKTDESLLQSPLTAFVVEPESCRWLLELPKDVLQTRNLFPADRWPKKIDRGWIEYVHVRYGRSALGGVQKPTPHAAAANPTTDAEGGTKVEK